MWTFGMLKPSWGMIESKGSIATMIWPFLDWQTQMDSFTLCPLIMIWAKMIRVLLSRLTERGFWGLNTAIIYPMQYLKIGWDKFPFCSGLNVSRIKTNIFYLIEFLTFALEINIFLRLLNILALSSWVETDEEFNQTNCQAILFLCFSNTTA